jgi:small-conductance mechanosensitive channel
MTMKPGLRKLVLSAHLTFSIGWIGTVVAYLALGVLAVNSSDTANVRGAWMAMELIGWYVIVPLAVASLLTGVVMALGTKWGLFRHYWVSISFFLTLFATMVLILHMPSVSSTAQTARTAEGEVLESLGGDLHHPAVGLVILLVVQVLNLYKPKGLTRYGWRKQQEESAR